LTRSSGATSVFACFLSASTIKDYKDILTAHPANPPANPLFSM
jgi:hypothetical protein